MKGRHWFKVAPSLREKDRSRGQWVILALMVVFAVVGGSFAGFIIETQALNPPTQVVGVCPSPAFVSGNDCVQRVCNTGSDNQETCRLQPAGYVIGANQTRVVCTGNVCVGTA